MAGQWTVSNFLAGAGAGAAVAALRDRGSSSAAATAAATAAAPTHTAAVRPFTNDAAVSSSPPAENTRQHGDAEHAADLAHGVVHAGGLALFVAPHGPSTRLATGAKYSHMPTPAITNAGTRSA